MNKILSVKPVPSALPPLDAQREMVLRINLTICAGQGMAVDMLRILHDHSRQLNLDVAVVPQVGEVRKSSPLAMAALQAEKHPKEPKYLVCAMLLARYGAKTLTPEGKGLSTLISNADVVKKILSAAPDQKEKGLSKSEKEAKEKELRFWSVRGDAPAVLEILCQFGKAIDIDATLGDGDSALFYALGKFADPKLVAAKERYKVTAMILLNFGAASSIANGKSIYSVLSYRTVVNELMSVGPQSGSLGNNAEITGPCRYPEFLARILELQKAKKIPADARFIDLGAGVQGDYSPGLCEWSALCPDASIIGFDKPEVTARWTGSPGESFRDLFAKIVDMQPFGGAAGKYRELKEAFLGNWKRLEQSQGRSGKVSGDLVDFATADHYVLKFGGNPKARRYHVVRAANSLCYAAETIEHKYPQQLPIKLKLLLVPFNNLLENGGYFYVDILSVDAILTNVVPDDKLFGNKPYTPENLRAFEKFFSELFAGLTQDRCDGVRFCTPDLPMTNGHFVLTLPLQTGGTGVMASAPLLEIRKKA